MVIFESPCNLVVAQVNHIQGMVCERSHDLIAPRGVGSLERTDGLAVLHFNNIEQFVIVLRLVPDQLIFVLAAQRLLVEH